MNRPSIARAAAIAALVVAAACSSSTSNDPCAPGSIPAGLGCEFWPTVTANAVDGAFAFGIALSNPGTAAASVHVDGAGLGAGLDLTVPAATSAYRTLPWVGALKACDATGVPCTAATGTSILAAGGAYHVTSTQPIAAYQFSPALGAFEVGSADATALPDTSALGRSYVAVSWAGAAGGSGYPGLVAVTAVADATAVQITPTAAVAAGDLEALAAGAAATVTLNRGDVLELLAASGDLTGTRIVADKPVQVIGGHFCATVPVGTPYCDHLEEVVPPIPALGTSHVVVPPTPLLHAPIVVRVVATAPNTALSYAPPVVGAPSTVGDGEYADFELSAPVLITSTAPVLVAQYLEGSTVGGVGGDPSLAIAAPVARWRTSYTVEIPSGSGGGSVDVVATAGANVTYDGNPLWFGRPDETGYVRTTLGYSGGKIRFEGDRPFTVSTYGYGASWSYWYAPAFAP